MRKNAHTNNYTPRVAPRLEGVVKNRGIKPVKKPKKGSRG